VVFISHSSKDRWVAKQIAAHISKCGARPFPDEADIEVGDDFEKEILESLEKADELVVLMTPWALERPHVWAELGGGVEPENPHRHPAARHDAWGISIEAWHPGLSQETGYD
jgi:hypothetical protein